MRFFVLLLCGAAFFSAGAEKLNSIIAIVNDQSISRVEFERNFAGARQLAAQQGAEIGGDALRKQVLDAMVSRLLQAQEARRLGANIPDSMLEGRLSALAAEWGVAGGGSAINEAIRQIAGMPPEEFRRQLREDMEIEAAFYREVYGKIEIYDEEVEQFLRAESDLAGGREYRLRHILIPAPEGGDEARARAEELRKRIADGESFADLAREHSAGDNAAAGGDLGWRAEEQLPAPFVAEAQNLSPGETGEVIATGRGFHLLQLAEKRGGSVAAKTSRLRLAHIFLPVEEQTLAKTLRRRLAAGEDFAELAREHSADERSAGNGGDLGWFLPGNLPAYFAPAKTLGKNETSAPIVSPFGIHLLRVLARGEVNMEAARAEAREALRERRAQAQRLDWIRRLRNRAHIIIIDPAFGNLIDERGR
ncbi:MAG: peptidylprolyl isomerase [Gammaproteobacteria bacterium]